MGWRGLPRRIGKFAGFGIRDLTIDGFFESPDALFEGGILRIELQLTISISFSGDRGSRLFSAKLRIVVCSQIAQLLRVYSAGVKERTSEGCARQWVTGCIWICCAGTRAANAGGVQALIDGQGHRCILVDDSGGGSSWSAILSHGGYSAQGQRESEDCRSACGPDKCSFLHA